MPDPDKEFIVHTDASGYATGAVLMQKFAEGLRPIAFLSKKMKKAERNYPVYEQELLAILNALRAWRHYLGGRHFTVWTDHQSLQYVEASAMATPRQVRWATWLSEFDFNIKYTPGETNVVADGLSRAGAGPARAGLLISAVSAMAPMPIRIKRAAVNDARYQELLARSACQTTPTCAHGCSAGLMTRSRADTAAADEWPSGSRRASGGRTCRRTRRSTRADARSASEASRISEADRACQCRSTHRSARAR